jgi:hypothetical protein
MKHKVLKIIELTLLGLAGVCELKEGGACQGRQYRMLLKIFLAILNFSDTNHIVDTSNFAP